MKIHELEDRVKELNKRIMEISQISPKSTSDLREWRECKLELAIAEDSIEMLQSRAKSLRERSNLGKRFSSRTFDTFNQNENKKIYVACKRYVDNRIFDAEKNGLIICGACGTGKTHLAAAIANSLADEGVSVLFDTFGGHLEKLKEEFSAEGRPGYMNFMKSVDMLILDDVGKEKQTEWSESVMFGIINSRYESMKPVIITSNFSQAELEEYFGNACYSRLIEMCYALNTSGEDYRRK